MPINVFFKGVWNAPRVEYLSSICEIINALAMIGTSFKSNLISLINTNLIPTYCKVIVNPDKNVKKELI